MLCNITPHSRKLIKCTYPCRTSEVVSPPPPPSRSVNHAIWISYNQFQIIGNVPKNWVSSDWRGKIFVFQLWHMNKVQWSLYAVHVTKPSLGQCSSSYKVSRDWLATLLENNRTHKRTIPPTLKTIADATCLRDLQHYCFPDSHNNNTVLLILTWSIMHRNKKINF